MKTLKFLFFLLWGVLPLQAQEYTVWEFTVQETANRNMVYPIDVTVEKSTSKMEFDFNRLFENISSNEWVTKLTFKGYNPGEAQTRHVKVWLSNRLSNDAKCLFDADCTIPHGGSEEESITLLDLPLDEPYKFKNEEHTYIMIESTGVPAEQPLVFEQQDGLHVVTITAKAEVARFTGTVKDQDGKAIQGACVNIFREIDGTDVLSYAANTDSEGRFYVRVEHGGRSSCLTVSASGYPDYLVDWPFILTGDFITMWPAPSGEIVMTNRLDFRVDQQATIILPETPDPSWGRYYRLDHRYYEGDEYVVIFVHETTPQANVPYVIFPERDFSIDLTKYDKESLPEVGRQLFPDMMDAENPWGLYGTYQSRVAHHMGVIGSSLLDSTPDCQVGTPNSFPRIGAFHAYLLGYHTGSQYDDGPKMMFVDETNNISEIPEGKTQVSPIFDLQGRQLHGIPQKGVYIQNGRKYVK